jgi:hypothetical protein
VNSTELVTFQPPGADSLLFPAVTGSAKTTLLNPLLPLVPPDQRLVPVEDASELRPEYPDVVALEAVCLKVGKTPSETAELMREIPHLPEVHARHEPVPDALSSRRR